MRALAQLTELNGAGSATGHLDTLPWKGVAALPGALLLLACFAWPEDEAVTVNAWILYLLTGCFALCLFVLLSASRAGRVRSLLEWKPLVIVGTFSYSIYLLHACLMFPFGSFLSTYAPMLGSFPRGAIFFILVAAETLLIVAASYLFHLAYEKPCMK
jgi:peptidoglycan/LPS O-acetylase OafA/YrhL